MVNPNAHSDSRAVAPPATESPESRVKVSAPPSPLPPNSEVERLAVVLDYAINPTAADPALDDLASLAAGLCGTSMAAISLVGADRVWFKARVGFTLAEVSRDHSLCGQVVRQNDCFVVPDTLMDPRYAPPMPVMDGLPLRFYAGVPLRVAPQTPIGALCVLDSQPREISTGQLQSLAALARQVAAQFELQRCQRRLSVLGQEQQQLREDLREARERAASAGGLQNEFLANLNHEIRTPLTGVIGMTGLLLGETRVPGQMEQLEWIKSSVEWVLQMFNDWIDFSLYELGQWEVERGLFNLRELVAARLKTLAFHADKKGVELVVDLPVQWPARYWGDARRLGQMLFHLADNAVKFTLSGQVLVVVEIPSTVPEESNLHVAVMDTGVGIPEDKKNLISRAFSQPRPPLHRPHDGLGLGLSLCAFLASRLGGRLWMESAPRQGSAFHFTIPLAPDGADSETGPAPDPRLQERRILVIDDNLNARVILEKWLTFWRYQAVLAANVPEGTLKLEEAREQGRPFDLVLLDAGLPASAQAALVHSWEARQPAPETLVLLMTPAQTACAAPPALAAAPRLMKPLNPDHWHTRLREILIQRSAETKSGETADPGAPRQHEARRPMKILVAEDSLINQRVIAGLLSSLGHTSHIVNNGREALTVLETSDFQAVLMDLQMPEMDGFEAAAAIRQKERTTGRHLPIIALTAQGGRSYREKCLAAGMDAFMTKPVTLDSLRQGLAALPQPASVPPPSPPAEEVPPILDFDSLLRNLDGNFGLVREMRNIFQEESPSSMAKLSEAIVRRDLKAMRSVAHRIKGMTGHLSATTAYERARQLENIETAAGWSKAEALCRQLALDMVQLLRALDDHLSADGTKAPSA